MLEAVQRELMAARVGTAVRAILAGMEEVSQPRFRTEILWCLEVPKADQEVVEGVVEGEALSE